MNMNIKELKRVIKKFRIDSGTIMLVKTGTPMADKMTLESFNQAVREMGLRNVLVIVVDDLDDVTVLNRLDMNRLGWFRKEEITRLLTSRSIKAQKMKGEKVESN